MPGVLTAPAGRPPAPNDVPVIVLNWNGWEHTFRCLQALKGDAGVGAVWLVDNASATDRTAEAASLWPGLRIVRLDRNYGFAGGMNRALRLAAAENHAFAYLLNNDGMVLPGFLRAALEAASEPDIAMVGSRIADLSNGVIFDGVYYRPGEWPLEPRRGSRVVAQVNGAGMLVRIAALESGGYLDERFFCYHEEVELGRRLMRAGWRLAVADESIVLHTREGSNISSNALYYRTRNRFLLAWLDQGRSRWKGLLRALRRAGTRARRATAEGHHEDCAAVITAVKDALLGRFGQRKLRADPFASWLLYVLCVLPARRALPRPKAALPGEDLLATPIGADGVDSDAGTSASR